MIQLELKLEGPTTAEGAQNAGYVFLHQMAPTAKEHDIHVNVTYPHLDSTEQTELVGPDSPYIDPGQVSESIDRWLADNA